MSDQNSERTRHEDRREHVLDPAAGAAGQPSESIRDEQGTHEAGAVPAAFTGDDGQPEGERPESGEEPDSWDSAGHRG